MAIGQLHHVGILAKDLDKAVQFYSEALGLGPFRISEISLDNFVTKGKPAPFAVKVAFTSIGPIELEFIEVTQAEGEYLHTEFLQKKGEGLRHLSFYVPKLEDALSHLAKLGIEATSSYRVGDTEILAFLNEDKTFGVAIELVQAGREEQR